MVMKNKLLLLFVVSAINIGFTPSSFAANEEKIINLNNIKEQEIIDLNLNNTEKHEINVSNKGKKIDGKFIENEKSLKEAFVIQKKKDVEDIKILWESTVSRNSIIKFALKKLAMPPEQRRLHSSLMARTVSTLINGVSFLPSAFGADSALSTASFATGSLANRVIQKKTMPKEMPLTDTELIQLAGLIEDLQDKLINNYYEYKSSIEALRDCRKKLLVHNRNYSNALKSKDDVSIIVTSAMYDKQKMQEIRLVQKIKNYRIELERLAGAEVVSNLNLSKVSGLAFNNDEGFEKNNKKVNNEK